MKNGNSQMSQRQISLTALHEDQRTLHGDQGKLRRDHGTLHAQACGICYRQAQQ